MQMEILIIMSVNIILFLLPAVLYWRIFSKAGYSGALGLLAIVPIINLAALCILAFGDWPALRRL